MLSLLLSVFVVVLSLIILWKRHKQQKDSLTTIPGPKKGSTFSCGFEEGDFGKQMNFLKELHKQYGPIASFWEGDKMAVSIESPELFKETRNMNDVPSALFEPFRDLIGDEGFAFQGTEEALRRRKLYDQYFMMKACKTHFDVVKEVAEEFISKWQKNSATDEIPLVSSVLRAACKAVLRVTFGELFANDEKLDEFKNEFQTISNRLGETLKPGSPEHEAQQKGNCSVEFPEHKDTRERQSLNRK